MEGQNEEVELKNKKRSVVASISNIIPVGGKEDMNGFKKVPIELNENPIASNKTFLGYQGEFPGESKESFPNESQEEYPEEYPEGYLEEYPEGYPIGEGGEEEYVDEEGTDEDWGAEVGGSEPTPLGGLYGLFKDVAHKVDTKRVSNLTKEELGIWKLSVRDCERIALTADTFHHPGVAMFFRKQSRIITDTAMSKGGWFTELFITSKKFASRDTSSSIANLPQYNKKSKWRMFSEKENQPVQEA